MKITNLRRLNLQTITCLVIFCWNTMWIYAQVFKVVLYYHPKKKKQKLPSKACLHFPGNKKLIASMHAGHTT